jgi:hypothetical protein
MELDNGERALLGGAICGLIVGLIFYFIKLIIKKKKKKED